jgi:pimeloyl-ACP methyl ester carboxylesterase
MLHPLVLIDSADALSWGTQFASQYAHLFPNNIRAMILDAIVDHSVSNVEIGQSESTTSK